MNILAVGDVVGECGCDFLMKTLPKIKKEYNIDFCVVNGENSAVGNGITQSSARHIFSVGADVITTGNHVFRKKEIYDYLDDEENILRPANMHWHEYGRGFVRVDMGRESVTVINLMGKAFFENIDDPFEEIDKILEEVGSDKNIIVDLHAEATGEKRALGFYLDGKISALFGTHTHVQTSDETILPLGTGYITDVGMTGAELSCLGVKSECVIEKLRTGENVKFEQATGKAVLGGCVFTLDKDGKCVEVKRILIKE